jgi:RNA-binding protein YhbY
LIAQVGALPLHPSWLEALDACLWQEELVLVRLNNAVAKKKGAKLLGERIAAELDAHVAQVVGHTVLLYRPGLPPVLDLRELMEQQRSKDED